MGAPSIPPGRYFRMHMIGYFEGIDSERGIEWRCSDALSLREFLRLETAERVPDHSWMSKTRGRLPHEVHEQVFAWVLALIGEHVLVRGERIGVDASTLEANAALRQILRRDTGAGYREMLQRMAEARIARMKDGTTHLAYKPEHAVDLDSGAVIAAEIHLADEGDTATITGTLEAAQRNLAHLGAPPCPDAPADCVADKGYHSRAVLKDLDGSPWRSRIAEPQRTSFSRWHGDEEARRAVYNNRVRLRSAVGKQAMRKRAEIVERSFAHVLDRGGMRRTWLRGRENVHKRYLIHVAGHNLGLLMRLLIGAGTPKEAVASGWCLLVLLPTSDDARDEALIMVLVATSATPALIVFTTRFRHRLATKRTPPTGC